MVVLAVCAGVGTLAVLVGDTTVVDSHDVVHIVTGRSVLVDNLAGTGREGSKVPVGRVVHGVALDVEAVQEVAGPVLGQSIHG